MLNKPGRDLYIILGNQILYLLLNCSGKEQKQVSESGATAVVFSSSSKEGYFQMGFLNYTVHFRHID